MHGIVIRTTGTTCLVRTDEGKTVECRVKGTFRIRGIRSTNPVAVGDGVTIKATPNEQTALIISVDDRRNYIIRRASNLSKQSHILAANIDLALLFVTVARPITTPTFIDRFLASAEAYGVPVALVFNKTDDLTTSQEKEQQTYLQQIYANIGYTTYTISALQGSGIEKLKKELQGKTTLLAGHSGVGKSTLINTLIPTANVRIAAISDAHGTGMHTTTYSQLYELPSGGALIDIPGIKGFGTFNIFPNEVAHYFTDIFRISEACKFSNCTHTHEPDCAVLQALENHQLAPSRYASYLSMLTDYDEEKYRPAFK